jgi:hypothetical protein
MRRSFDCRNWSHNGPGITQKRPRVLQDRGFVGYEAFVLRKVALRAAAFIAAMPGANQTSDS